MCNELSIEKLCQISLIMSTRRTTSKCHGRRTGRGVSQASNPALKRQRVSRGSKETISVNTPLTATDIPTLIQAILDAIPGTSSHTNAPTVRSTVPVDPLNPPSLFRPRTRQTTSQLPTEQTSSCLDRAPTGVLATAHLMPWILTISPFLSPTLAAPHHH